MVKVQRVVVKNGVLNPVSDTAFIDPPKLRKGGLVKKRVQPVFDNLEEEEEDSDQDGEQQQQQQQQHQQQQQQPPSNTIATSYNEAVGINNNDDLMVAIVKRVPSGLHRYVDKVLNYLLTNVEDVTFDVSDKLFYQGQSVPGAKMSSILTSICSRRIGQQLPPLGETYVLSALIHAPKDVKLMINPQKFTPITALTTPNVKTIKVLRSLTKKPKINPPSRLINKVNDPTYTKLWYKLKNM
jgi:hypothetical protein